MEIHQVNTGSLLVVKNPPINAGDIRDMGLIPEEGPSRKVLWKKKWQPTPVFLPGESHRQKSQTRYSPWGHKKSDATEQLRLSLSYTCTCSLWHCKTVYYAAKSRVLSARCVKPRIVLFFSNFHHPGKKPYAHLSSPSIPSSSLRQPLIYFLSL